MILYHTKSDQKNDYHYFSTDRSVTVQIGQSTNKGKYLWSVYHPDIKCAVWGDETETIQSAKEEAAKWIVQWVEPPT